MYCCIIDLIYFWSFSFCFYQLGTYSFEESWTSGIKGTAAAEGWRITERIRSQKHKRGYT